MENINIIDLSAENCQQIYGGDGLTKAVFWLVGSFIRAQSRELDGIGGPTVRHM